MRELGMTVPIFNGTATPMAKTYREAAGKALEGVIYGGFKYDAAAAKPFIDAYHTRMGFDPDFAGLEDYDMVNMIAAAIRKNGYDGEGIRSFVAYLKDFKSIGGGLVSMDPDGQSIVSVGLYEVVDVEKPVFKEIQP
jgi:ABC-type branched-subunit amino acid transport system substrate-binding protein